MVDARDPAFQSPASRESGRRFKKRSFATGFLVLAVLGIGALLLLSSIPLASSSAREDIEARLERLTGSPVHVDGNAEFSLFPRTRVTLTDVRIGAGSSVDALDLEIDRVEADFDLLDALTGGADIKRVTLIRPELSATDGAPVPVDEAAVALPGAIDPANPAAAIDTRRSSSLMKALLIRFEGLNELRIHDGLFRLPNQPGGISNANLSFRWEAPSEPATLSGSYVWNGLPTEINARVDRPLAFLEGSLSPLRLQLKSPTLETAFAGEGAAGGALRLAGGLQLSAPSLSRAIRWLGDSSLALPDFGAFSIETQIQILGDKINLGAASLDLGGNSGHGALEAVLTGEEKRPAISGTLAFEQLNFGGFTQAIAPAPKTLIDLQRPLQVGFISKFDMDLRVSAEQASLGRVAVSEVAATIKAANGIATLDIGDMAVFGGRGEMRFALDAAPARPSLSVAAGLRGVQMADLSRLADTPLPLTTGTGDLDLIVKSPAVNWGEILMGNRSELTLSVDNGTLAGLDRTMMRNKGRHLVAISSTATQEPFLRLEAHARSLGPRVRFDDLSIELDGGEVDASGLYDLRNGQVSAAGQFRPSMIEASGLPAAFTPSKPIEFTVEGEWPKPMMTVGQPGKPI